MVRLSGPRFDAIEATSPGATATAAGRAAALRPGAVNLIPPGSLSGDLVIGDELGVLDSMPVIGPWGFFQGILIGVQELLHAPVTAAMNSKLNTSVMDLRDYSLHAISPMAAIFSTRLT